MSDARPVDDGAPGVSQRIDKWLWHARFFRTRSLAAKAVAEGRMRLTRGGATTRLSKASALVRAGDDLSFSVRDRLFVLRIIACGARRGPASEARGLYEDLSPPPDRDADARRGHDRVGPRPTKRERRALEAARAERGQS